MNVQPFSDWKEKEIQCHLMSQMWHQQQKEREQRKKIGADLRVFGVDMI